MTRTYQQMVAASAHLNQPELLPLWERLRERLVDAVELLHPPVKDPEDREEVALALRGLNALLYSLQGPAAEVSRKTFLDREELAGSLRSTLEFPAHELAKLAPARSLRWVEAFPASDPAAWAEEGRFLLRQVRLHSRD